MVATTIMMTAASASRVTMKSPMTLRIARHSGGIIE
jgi:hypothetical protein